MRKRVFFSFLDLNNFFPEQIKELSMFTDTLKQGQKDLNNLQLKLNFESCENLDKNETSKDLKTDQQTIICKIEEAILGIFKHTGNKNLSKLDKLESVNLSCLESEVEKLKSIRIFDTFKEACSNDEVALNNNNYYNIYKLIKTLDIEVNESSEKSLSKEGRKLKFTDNIDFINKFGINNQEYDMGLLRNQDDKFIKKKRKKFIKKNIFKVVKDNIRQNLNSNHTLKKRAIGSLRNQVQIDAGDSGNSYFQLIQANQLAQTLYNNILGSAKINEFMDKSFSISTIGTFQKRAHESFENKDSLKGKNNSKDSNDSKDSINSKSESKVNNFNNIYNNNFNFTNGFNIHLFPGFMLNSSIQSNPQINPPFPIFNTSNLNYNIGTNSIGNPIQTHNVIINGNRANENIPIPNTINQINSINKINHINPISSGITNSLGTQQVVPSTNVSNVPYLPCQKYNSNKKKVCVEKVCSSFSAYNKFENSQQEEKNIQAHNQSSLPIQTNLFNNGNTNIPHI